MCVACGLPTTHANYAQFLGWTVLFFFTLTTFLSAWLIVPTGKVQRLYKKTKDFLLHTSNQL